MKILLIEQIKKSSGSSNRFLTSFLTSFSILPTLYIRQLAAITPKKHQITIWNERYQNIYITNEFDLIVIHFSTGSAKRAYQIADQFKKKGNPVVLCGLHASALPNEASNHAHSILLGRGECNWLSLLRDVELGKLKPLYPPQPFDSIRCKIPPTNLKLPGFIIMGAIEASRNCPYQCDFCPEGNTPSADSFYARPVDEVVEELRHIHQRIIMFYDLSLTIDPAYTKSLFIKMQSLNKHFFCNGNIDVLSKDPELVRLSKRAGCIGWLIGFESFNQETLDAIGKTSNKVQDYKKGIDLIHDHNMLVIGDFMFGFDSDKPSVFDTTYDMIKQLKIDVADFTILTPFPGTPLFARLQQEARILTTDWNEYTMFKPVFEPKQMSPEELQNGVFSLYERFYSPKETIPRILRSLPRGFYPLSSSFSRNLLASFNTMLFTK